MSKHMDPDDIPEFYRPYLQDWIALAKSPAVGKDQAAQ
jgi:hypothetical protein